MKIVDDLEQTASKLDPEITKTEMSKSSNSKPVSQLISSGLSTPPTETKEEVQEPTLKRTNETKLEVKAQVKNLGNISEDFDS